MRIRIYSLPGYVLEGFLVFDNQSDVDKAINKIMELEIPNLSHDAYIYDWKGLLSDSLTHSVTDVCHFNILKEYKDYFIEYRKLLTVHSKRCF